MPILNLGEGTATLCFHKSEQIAVPLSTPASVSVYSNTVRAAGSTLLARLWLYVLSLKNSQFQSNVYYIIG